MFTFMGMRGELLLYQRILLPGKAKIFVVSFADRDSRWVLSPRVFSKIFCHYASVNSSSAHPPPGLTPRALAFLKKNGGIPRGGDT